MTEPKTPEATRDLRAAVEGLPGARVFGVPYGPGAVPIVTDRTLVNRNAVLALIPPGSVVVTAETLAEALHDAGIACQWDDPAECRRYATIDPFSAESHHGKHAAAILARLQAKP